MDPLTLVPIMKGFLIICVTTMIVWLFAMYKGARAREFALRQINPSSLSLNSTETDATEKKNIERMIREQIELISSLADHRMRDVERLKDSEIALFSAWILREHFEIPRRKIVDAVQRLGESWIALEIASYELVPEKFILGGIQDRLRDLNLIDRLAIAESYKSEINRLANIVRRKAKDSAA